jgi:hypothetical protein
MATSIPPHNAAELIDAATHLIDDPKASDAALMDFVAGPDFPTGGVVADAPRRSPPPIAPAAGPSGCAPAGARRTRAGGRGR